MKKKKAQAAIEFLFVVGFAMLLIIPSLALFGRFVEETAYTATTSQVNKIGNYMVTTAVQAYQGTNGTIIIIEANFPDGVQNMSIVNENELVFLIDIGGKRTEQVYYSKVPLSGSFNYSDVEKGLKKFRFTAINSGYIVFIERYVK
ncbi:MAG: hypothetical protein WC254_05350 [Candidatus Woesearchaeota archaeon]|jgi:hypothetical protein